MDFAVKFYDGKNIPFPNESLDVIFSSNVLEHVQDLKSLQAAIRRVLKPSGYCIDLMPSATWRFWTILAHYIELTQKLFDILTSNISMNSPGDFCTI
jgi:ubiquinone/menaquinone biosynthesis C-methylase UbiE